MNWVKLITDFIASISWQLLIVFILICFRKEFSHLINRLKKLQIGDNAIDLDKLEQEANAKQEEDLLKGLNSSNLSNDYSSVESESGSGSGTGSSHTSAIYFDEIESGNEFYGINPNDLIFALKDGPHSFRYLRKKRGFTLSDDEFESIINNNPDRFESTRIIRRDDCGNRIIPGWPAIKLHTRY